jgi:NADPH:quinone reductase-like Zn-dependent oxidoreductase
LKIEEIEVREPGANEVRIKVAAIGMNFAEVMWRRNEYLETPQLPAGLGYEASGTIEKLGPGVQGFKIGDKVSTFPAQNQGNNSAYGELVVMPVTSVARYPQRLTEVEAASYWMAYMTGYFALFDVAKVSRGETVLITAASSSTGLAAIQLAKLAGLRVIATTRTSKKAAALKKAGADIVVATEEENLVERVLAATNGEGAEVVYDAVGGAQFATLGKATKRHGHLILYGYKGDGEMAVPIWDLFIRTLKFHVYKVLDFTGAPTLGIPPDTQAVERAITFINSNIEKGLLNPTVDCVFKFDDIVAAHRYVESGVQTGKIVVTTR